jgi:hypothetical protein
MLPYPDLFVWWAGTITAGILFLSLVSVVLYFLAKKRDRVSQGGILRSLFFDVKRFAFVWVLLTLLVLYIVSIDGQNYTMFAVGNVVIEVFIFSYLVLTRKNYQTYSEA